MEKDIESEISSLIEKHKAEATKNVINAFNEGYLLGSQYAKQLYGKDNNENKS